MSPDFTVIVVTYCWEVVSIRVLVSTASLIFLRHVLDSLASTFTSSSVILCLFIPMCSPTTLVGSLWPVCSLILQPPVLPVSPMYVSPHSEQNILHATLHFRWFLVLSLWCTSNDLTVLRSLWNVPIPCCYNIGVSFLDSPLMYGRSILGVLVLL